MKITLIRHGESLANVGHFINDNPAKPVHLTDKGRAQAESLALRLRDEIFTHAYASEFPRTQQTANILLRQHRCRSSASGQRSSMGFSRSARTGV